MSGLVPLDFPQRLAARGLAVHVVAGWESRGSSADHDAVVFHWTASSSNESPSSCANYCFLNATYAPDYGVLCDRNGEVWVGARNKANSSGEISGVALNEALEGRTDWRSAASRGLSDTTSANNRLWAISAQNNGVGEPWSAGLVNTMAVTAAVSLECLGLGSSSYVTHHAALTRRKIDLTAGTGGCPDGGEWNRRITDALGGGGVGPGPAAGSLLELGMTIIYGPLGAALVGAGYWQNIDMEGLHYWQSVQGMVTTTVDQRGWDVMRASALYGAGANPRGESG